MCVQARVCCARTAGIQLHTTHATIAAKIGRRRRVPAASGVCACGWWAGHARYLPSLPGTLPRSGDDACSATLKPMVFVPQRMALRCHGCRHQLLPPVTTAKRRQVRVCAFPATHFPRGAISMMVAAGRQTSSRSGGGPKVVGYSACTGRSANKGSLQLPAGPKTNELHTYWT